MTKLKLNYFFDVILTFLIIFVLLYSWANFYLKNITKSFIIAFLLTSLIVFLLFKIKTKFENKKGMTIKQKEQAQNLCLQLRFLSTQKIVNFFYEAIKQKEEVKKHKFFLETNTQIFYPYFEKKTLNLDALCLIFKHHFPQKELVIICCEADKETCVFCGKIQNKHIKILNFEEIYNKFLQNATIYPNEVELKKEKKLKLKELLLFSLQKERTKNYLLMGLILITSSFFVLYKIYYLIFGSLLLFLAILTRILPYFKKEKK